MKVRFVFTESDERVFDKTVDLPTVPLPGETVGIDWPENSKFKPPDASRLVEVDYRRWFVGGDEPIVVCWLTDDEGSRRRNLYVHSGCRYGFEQSMREVLLERGRR